MTDLDDLRKRVEIYANFEGQDGDLIRDLWRAVQEQHNKLEQYAMAPTLYGEKFGTFEPVTAEELDYCMHDNWKEDRSLADSIIRILGPLYRQRKP
jgi:hypothetical protein